MLKIFIYIIISILILGCSTKPINLNSTQTIYSKKSMIKAVKDGNISLIAKHLESKVNINTKGMLNNTLLHLAVIAKNNKLVKFLLDNKANINSRNKSGFTPLHLAVKQKTKSIIATLLDNDANVNIVDNSGFFAIHTATASNELSIVKMILKKQPDNFSLKTKEGLTPFLLSISFGHLKLINFYLENGANLNSKTYANLTALQLAMRSNSVKTFNFLLNKGANIEQKTVTNKSLLHLASEAGSINIVKLLVQKGIKIGLKDDNNNLALDYAVINSHATVVTFLLKRYFTFSNTYKFRLLKKGVIAKDIKTLVALHEGGIPLETIKINTKSSILHFAVSKKGMQEVISLILKKTKLVTYKDAKGITALDYAIVNQNDSYIKIIKPFYLKSHISTYISQNNFLGLKALSLKNPDVLKYIDNQEYKLALNGPKELMIGDIKYLYKQGRANTILIAQINRLTNAYKDFTSNEIEILLKYSLPAPIIAAILNKSNKLKLKKKQDKEKNSLKLIQEAILKVEKLALKAQKKVAKLQKISVEQIKKLLKRQEQFIKEQIATKQILKDISNNLSKNSKN